MQVTTYNLYNDMLSQPHLLIAGATGSGKSVIINGLIYTLLTRDSGCGEGGAEFILIDPKRVELSAYKDMPHTLLYASEPEDMRSALAYAMRLIDSRYKTMQSQHVRKWQGGDIYIIIDEFADLMTTDKKHVMPLIQRIAQVGRAASVHLIIATQTPIAKVLPTEIKCNFDARVALRTRSAQDSRNILGEKGAENLPRYGECYYMKPEGTEHYKVPYYTDTDITAVLDYWYRLAPPKSRGFFNRLFGR